MHTFLSVYTRYKFKPVQMIHVYRLNILKMSLVYSELSNELIFFFLYEHSLEIIVDTFHCFSWYIWGLFPFHWYYSNERCDTCSPSRGLLCFLIISIIVEETIASELTPVGGILGTYGAVNAKLFSFFLFLQMLNVDLPRAFLIPWMKLSILIKKYQRIYRLQCHDEGKEVVNSVWFHDSLSFLKGLLLWNFLEAVCESRL